MAVRGVALHYAEFFHNMGMPDAPMPMKKPNPAKNEKGKTPFLTHKDGKFTTEYSLNWWKVNGAKHQVDLGICMRSLIAIDVDCPELAARMEARFPCMATAVQATTRKGRHYVWRRSQLCEDLQIWDGAGRLWEGGEKLPVDIKTICETGTAGMLMVAPSPDKSWVGEPLYSYVRGVPEFPDELAHWVADCSQRKRRRTDAPEPARLPGTRLRLLPTGEARAGAEPANDEEDLVALGFPASLRSNCVLSKTGDGYTFHAKELRPCPLCGDLSGHTSNFVVRYLPDGGRYLSNFSDKCAKPARLLPSTAAGAIAWRLWFQAQCDALPSTQVSRVADLVRRHLPHLGPHLVVGFRTRDLWYFRGEAEPPTYAELRLDGATYEFRLTKEPWTAARPDDERAKVPVTAARKLVAALYE